MTQIYADGADLDVIYALASDPTIEGFTTNPSLMWKAGLTDYREFAARILDRIPDKPVSFEVFGDDQQAIIEQAIKIRGWGDNVYVKIPVTTTWGDPLARLIGELANDGVKVNVTAVMTVEQVEDVCVWMPDGAESFISVFAGRIADTGIDPTGIVREAVAFADSIGSRIIWASPREILNLVQAEQVGCHVITMTPDLLAKRQILGKDLNLYSLETVRMFHTDAQKAGYSLD